MVMGMRSALGCSASAGGSGGSGGDVGACGACVGVGSSGADGIGAPVRSATAACTIALDMATQSALPTPRCALRLPLGTKK